VAVKYPPRLLPHRITVVHPTITTDVYGDQVRTYPGPGTETAAYVQPELGAEFNEARQQASIRKRLWTLDELAADDRIVFEGLPYDVLGPSRRYDTPDGPHHYESTMMRVEG
jgi:hypothetical protein